MKNRIFLLILFLGLLFFFQCTNNKTADDSSSVPTTNYGGYESQIKWGEHLVTIGACNDCHTPKKMTPHGPVLDSALWLSGHPAEMPRIDVNRKEMESKFLVVTFDLTEWVGPWGVSFTANITPDEETGIGTWTLDQFMLALREGKSKGLPGARPLLPPMPWEMYRFLSDDEIAAIFAYLKSIKPIRNIVPPPIPPESAGM